MAAKLVLVGAPPVEVALASFNTLGRHPDCSIRLDDAAEEHARIILDADGRYILRAIDGAVHVNGQRVDERELRSGDVIALGGATYRFETGLGPTCEPWRRTREPPQRIAPEWTCAPTRGFGQLVALQTGRLAVARAHPEGGRAESRLLVRDGDSWRVSDRLAGDVRGAWQMGDGSLIAGGPHACMHGHPGDLRAVPYPPARPPFLAWGQSWRCAYALSEAGLSHFDGARWRAIDLHAQGVERDTGNGRVAWAHGACDETGRSWLVGADLKHSTLATGLGATWERAGSAGIGALTNIACGADGTLFVVGLGLTRGLWPLGRASHRADATNDAALSVVIDPRRSAYAGSWRGLDGYRSESVIPLTLRCCELDRTRSVVVGLPLRDAPNELFVFLDARWTVVRLPAPSLSERGLVDVTRDGRLVFAAEDAIWESSPLFELIDV